LVLPRVVIDAVQDGKDVKYLVASTDLEAGAGASPDVTESETTDESRTVVIDYTKGTDLIEISGTSVVPEFGPISAIILALAIVAVILVTARFRNGNDSGNRFFNVMTGQ
jgi:predicted secreted protein with PEFG-CTERM motif